MVAKRTRKRVRKLIPSAWEWMETARAMSPEVRRSMDDLYMAGVRTRLGQRASGESTNWPLQRQWITRRW